MCRRIGDGEREAVKLKTRRVWWLLTLLLALAVIQAGLVGCAAKPASELRIRIADQFGLGYAPFTIMLEEGLIEKHLPGVILETVKLGSGGAVSEAMVAGTLDIGFMGMPPFLIGWDKGVQWKIAGALDSMPLFLLTYQDDILQFEDFKPGHKIALPGPGSNQHILLAMAAEQELGDAGALDDLIVALPHPDAAAALLAHREVTAYYSAPPYQFELLKSDPSLRVVAEGAEAFGENFSYIVAVASESFHRQSSDAYQAFVQALEDALAMLRDQPVKAAAILAAADGKVAASAYEEYITWPGVSWDIAPAGMMRYAEFMHQAGYISRIPSGVRDVTYPNLHQSVNR